METEVIKFVAPYKIEYIKKVLRPIKKNEVLVRTLACGICMREVHVYSGYIADRYPVVMGHEPVGIVEQVGEEVNHLLPGDFVTALAGECLARHFIADGIYVQNIKSPNKVEDMIAEPAMCAINAIRGSGLEVGDNVVVIGCGFMGLLLIQALSHTLSHKIIAIDLNENRLHLASKYGVDKTFLASDSNLQEKIESFIGKENINVIFEASGTERALHLSTQLVKKGGTLCLFGHQTGTKSFSFDEWHYKGIKVLNTVPWMSKDLAREFKDGTRLLEKGIFDMSNLITHRFNYYEAEKAMELNLKRPEQLIKSVILMD